jgi:hypothetical protein
MKPRLAAREPLGAELGRVAPQFDGRVPVDDPAAEPAGGVEPEDLVQHHGRVFAAAPTRVRRRDARAPGEGRAVVSYPAAKATLVSSTASILDRAARACWRRIGQRTGPASMRPEQQMAGE